MSSSPPSSVNQSQQSESAARAGSEKHPVAATISSQQLLLKIGSGFLRGVFDSTFSVGGFINCCLRVPKVGRDFLRCVGLNALFAYSLYAVAQAYTIVESRTDIDLQGARRVAGAKHDSDSMWGEYPVFALIWGAIFSAAWVVPMVFVTQILGVSWWNTMYLGAVEDKVKRTPGRSMPPERPMTFTAISEKLWKFIVTLLFSLISLTIGALVPFGIGRVVSFLMDSWLHAFYCFDYRFADQGITDSKTGRYYPLRLSAIFKAFEMRWAYFLGYGATHMAMRFALEYVGVSGFVNFSICSTVFCINVATSVEATPGPETPTLVVPVFSKLFVALCGTTTKRAAPTPNDEGGEEDAPEARNLVGKVLLTAAKGFLFLVQQWRVVCLVLAAGVAGALLTRN